MKKILHKSISAFLALTCFISFTFNGLTIASASVQSTSIALSGGLSANASSMAAYSFSLNSFNVDQFTGTASFPIPLLVPPGRSGVTPDLTLAYMGNITNGWCGVGWDLNLGIISRSTKNGIPKYNSSDIFAYNGSELVNIGGNEYLLKENYGNTKFIFQGTYWEVYDSSGTKMTFGNSANSKAETASGTFKWHLDRIEDLSGNYAEISYSKDQGAVYPLQIKYTGNTNTSAIPQYKINFSLESRSDVITNCFAGEIIKTAYRLSEIEELDGSNELIRKYVFDYKDSGASGRSLLETITLYGTDGVTHTNPITFTYNETIPTVSAISGNVISGMDGVPLGGDFNGDGMIDFAIYKNNEIKVAVCADNSFSTAQSWLSFNPGTDDWGLFSGDFNGDGYDDIGAKVTFPSLPRHYEFRVALNNGGTGFNSFGTSWYSGDTPSVLPLGVYVSTEGISLGDVNGDGKTDLAFCYYRTIDHSTYLILISTGGSFVSGGYKSVYFSEPRPWDGSGELTGDFDGDGLVDTFVRTTNNTGKVALAPFSGGNGSSSEWVTNLNTDKKIVLTDVNCDGRTDLIDFKESSGEWDVYLSNGSSFVASPDWITSFGANKIPMSGVFANTGHSVPAAYDSSTGNLQMAQSIGNTPDYLISVDNGIGGTVGIEYTSYQQWNLPFVLQVVASVSQNDGLEHEYTTSYGYSSAAYDRTAREFRGFMHSSAFDADNNRVRTFFYQDAILKGKVSGVLINSASNHLYADKVNMFTYDNPEPGVYNIHNRHAIEREYENQTTPRETKVTYTYDSYYGYLTNVYYYGDINVAGDEKEVITEYVNSPSMWVIGLPSHTYAEDYQSNKISEQWFYYDNSSNWTSSPTKGLLTKQENWLATGTNPTIEFGYDPYGNQTTITNVLNRTTATDYDTTNYLFPIKVTNALDQEITQTYDPKTGQVLTSTDANDQTTTNVYDVLGRLIKVIGPNDSETYPSLQYQYDLNTTPSKVTISKKVDNNNYITTYSFYDGLGRCIETKAPAENPQKQVVSGSTKYNSRGLVEESYFPYLVDTSSAYSAPDFNQEKTTYEYDPMGRLVQTIAPDGTIARSIYEIGKITGILEFNSTELQKSVSLFDAYGKLIEKQEFNDGQTYTTTYDYDALGNLKTLTDNQNNITTINYDTLGRKTSMDDPDMGVWSYSYDVLGNLISQTDAKNQTINFSYDELNRLFLKSSSSTSQTVLYEYDNATLGEYGIGRLYRVTDGSGSTEFYYDNIGREIKSEKTISGSIYTVERNYDGLNRITDITYPDGEIVSYTFNPSGAIETVTSQYATYVSGITYNANSQMSHIEYGNSTYTDYEYNPQTLRLDHLSTNGGSIQDLSYTFDHKSNITNIADSAYNTNQSFEYDDLNRLTTAIGTRFGTINYAYDSIGNMTHKNGIIYQYGTVNGDKPHAVTQYGDIALSYDPNGNMLSKGILNYNYDPENRLNSVSDATAYPTTQQITLDLVYGWNFITIPVEMEDPSISTVLDSIEGDYDQVTRFNSETQEFEHYVGNSDYNQFSTFECGKGYQIYITNSSGTQLTLSGTVPTNLKLNLQPGLNLLGNPKFITGTAKVCFEDLKFNLDYDSIWKYDTASGTLVDAAQSNLEPGKSVFVNVLKESIWTVNKQLGTTTFVYDGDGGRVKKIAPDLTTTYIGSLYEKQQEGANTKQINHIFLGSNRICSVNSQPAQPTIRAPQYYHSDHLGSSNVITDVTGQVVQHTEYEPFGKVITDDYTTDTPTNYKFTGKELDNTELYFYSARYYDPDLCRFITADPTIQRPGDPQDVNRYAYCRNNPLNYTDPSGYGWKKFWHKVEDTVKKVWNEIKEPLISATIVVTSFVLTGGLSALAQGATWLAAGSSAITTVGLGTWEGRQLINHVGKEFFDDVLGMRPGTAKIWAAVGLSIVGTWGMERIGAKMFLSKGEAHIPTDAKGNKISDSDGAWGGETLQPRGTLYGPDPQSASGPGTGKYKFFEMFDDSNQAIGTAVNAPLDGFLGTLDVQHIGINARELGKVTPWNTATYLTHGVCHQAANSTLALAGYSSTVTSMGIGGWSTYISTSVYGNYGGQLGGRIYVGMGQNN